MGKEIAVAEPSESNALMSLISRAASDPAFSVEKMEALLKVKERLNAEESRREFNVAFADFKAESVQIIKNTAVKDGPLKGKFHANLFDVVSATTPFLSKHGLSMSWKLTKDDPTWMEVSCTLRHVGGYSEIVSMGGAPDSGPGRNAIQARGSAKSYLERYTATAILGLAPQDADNDGNGAPSKPIKGPEEAPADNWKPAVAEGAKLGTRGEDTFQVGKTFLFKTKKGIEFRGPDKGQAYRIHEDVANLAKKNFKEGDTAKVGWVIKDDAKFLTELDRVAPTAAAVQEEF